MTTDDFEEQVRQAEATARAAEERLDPIAPRLAHVPTSPAAVRAHVTRLVVWSFVVYAGAVLAFIMLSKEMDKFTTLIEILKTMFLPIVTFVIGHYFGSKSE
jgi:hypothetical protein